MGMVETIVGPVERERLVVEDIVTEEPDKRIIATEWRLDGEIVKRDVWACILHGQALTGEQAEL